MRPGLVLSLLAWLFLAGLPSVAAAPPSYQDPPGYPGAWPDASWTPYTSKGEPLGDLATSSDPSTGGTTPTGAVDLVGLEASYFQGDGTNLYLRFNLGGSPLALSGSSQPYVSSSWNVLFDVDGDGYKEFALMLSGMDSSGHAQPDDLVVTFNDQPSQSVNPGTDTIWRQDAARHPTDFTGAGSDGESGSSASWDSDPDPWVWDFGRTRVTQRDTSLTPGSAKSEYFLDLQVPLAALDASSRGGPTLTSSSIVRFMFTTANSNTNPAQKDFAYLDGYTFGSPADPVPPGDSTDLSGNVFLQPVISRVAASRLCASGSELVADVAAGIETWNGQEIRTAGRQVQFQILFDADGDGRAGAGESWVTAGTVGLSVTNSTSVVSGGSIDNLVGPWRLPFDASTLRQGPYLVKVIASDDEGRTVDSADAASASLTYNPATQSSGGPVLGSFNNRCGTPPPSLKVTASPADVAVGEPVEFTITLTNPAGSGPISLDRITDTLPDGFVFQSRSGGSLTPSSSSASGQTLTWTFSPAVQLAGGSSETLAFTATAPLVTGTYANTAEASTDAGVIESNPGQVGVGAPSLTLLVDADVDSASEGQTVIYTLRYSNDSPVNTSGANLVASLPEGFEVTAVSAGGDHDQALGTVSWDLGDVPSGDGPHGLTVTGTVAGPYPEGAPSLLTLTAVLDSLSSEEVRASASVFIDAPRPRLSVQLDADSSLIAPGENVTFTVEYENYGTVPASGASLQLPVPPGFSFVSATAGGAESAGVVGWSLSGLAAGGSGSVQAVLQAAQPYQQSNPQTFTGTLSAAEVESVSDEYRVGIEHQPVSCYAGTVHYFVDTASSYSASAYTVSETPGGYFRVGGLSGNAVTPFLTAYQDEALADVLPLGETLTIDTFVTKSGGNFSITASLRYYDPATQTLSPAIGSASANTGGGTGEVPMAYSITTTAPAPAGTVLVWEFTSSTMPTWFGSSSQHTTTTYCAPAAPAPPSLLLDKQVDQLRADPGDALSYTLSFSNAGGTEATGATIIDILPEGTVFGSATLNGLPVSPSQNGQELTFSVQAQGSLSPGSIPSNSSGELIINATVASQLPPGLPNSVANTATLSSDTVASQADTASTVISRPDVSITKSADRTLVLPGETVTYEIEVVNGGTATATGVHIEDILPETAYYAYVPGSATLDGNRIDPDPVSGGTLSFDLASLTVGTRAKIGYSMTLAATGVPDGTTALQNSATVSDAATQGVRSSETLTVTASSNANLRLESAVSPDGPVAAGDVLSYTLTLTSSGASDAEDVSVLVPVPELSEYVPGSLTYQGVVQSDPADSDEGSSDAQRNRLFVQVGAFPAGSQVVIGYQLQVASLLPAGPNTIEAMASASASNTSVKVATASAEAVGVPEPALVKSGPPDAGFPVAVLSGPHNSPTYTVSVEDASYVETGSMVSVSGIVATVEAVSGNTLTLSEQVSGGNGTPLLPVLVYTLTYANSGTSDASEVVVADVLPAGLEFVGATPSPDTAPPVGSNGTVSWNVASLPAGSGGVITLLTRPGAAGTYSNSAAIDSLESDASESNVVTTRVGMLQAAKSTSTPQIEKGRDALVASYSITVENNLSDPVSSIYVIDVLPSGFSYASGSVTSGSCTQAPQAGDAVAEWSNCQIAANGSLVIQFDADIASDLMGGTFDNDIQVISDEVGVLQFRSDSSPAEDVELIVPGAELIGSVYFDADADGRRAGGEDWSAGVSVRVNLVKNGAAVASIAVGPGSGDYAFSGVEDGSYLLVLALSGSSAVPAHPSGWAFAEPSDGQRSLTVAGSDIADLDFGLHHGTRVRGVIFRDDGNGGGTANDALRSGSEAALANVRVNAGNGSASLSTTTAANGEFDLFIPAAWGSSAMIEHGGGPTTGVSSDGSVLATPTSFAQAAAFALVIDNSAGGTLRRDLGVVSASSFGSDAVGESLSPGSASYIHLFRPGTLGAVTFAAAGDHRYEFFVDEDCDGEVAPDEWDPVTSYVVDEKWPRLPGGAFEACPVMARVLVDEGVANGRTDVAMVSATLQWLGVPEVAEERQLVDVTMVREIAELKLDATVRNVASGSDDSVLAKGRPGDTLEYCAAYQNIGTRTLTDVEVRLPVPFHTDFLIGAYGSGEVSWDHHGEDLVLTSAVDGDAAALSGSLMVLTVGDLLPAAWGRACFRVAIR